MRAALATSFLAFGQLLSLTSAAPLERRDRFSSQIPSTWVNLSLPQDVMAIGLANLANKAAENLWAKHDSKLVFGDASQGWHAANVYTSIALNDKLVWPSQASRHSHIILNSLPILNTTVPFHNNFNDDALWWAHASLDAAEAYDPRNSTMFDLAYDVFHTIQQRSQIQPSWYDKMPGWKPIERNNACNLTGGVFWLEEPKWAGVPSIATTLFSRLGARLAHITGDQQFLGPAKAADAYIKKWTLVDEGIVVDGYNFTTCQLDRAPYSYNQGVFVASQVDLYKATKDVEYLRTAERAAIAGMKQAPYVNEAGQITENKGINNHIDGSNFRSIWIRHLRGLYQASDNKEVRDLIRSFVTVNTNLLLTAGDVKKGEYSQDWFGGFQPKTVEWGLCSAVDVLSTAYVVHTQ